ncbi:NAD(P)-dependent oxidoreductase [Candidatus Poribacteria bacterium]|nr:NAD(P)-dependent oxidoreductase [Candidatus Poribacteria bacterium]MYH82511.1 NAD(P)-dependent oxidoreductase [Candidatus Poribacteria bacterium]MYK92715.1 NAD(P)-dependent oxidoreductase [Candidatus Poribacteria bacterium]
MTSQELPSIGFIGLGNMGGRMAKNLHTAGYPLIGYDIDAAKCEALAAIGATAGKDTATVVRNSDVILTSLRSSDVFCSVVEQHFIPNAREGHVFIDLGTTEVEKTRDIATALAEKGATLIDAPVSGGPHGSETGTLRIFVGGDTAVVEKCRPILEVLGEPKYVVYCGPSGSGQIVKGVNQLAMGLGAAAYMEAMAFGVCAGVDPTAIREAVGMGDGWRGQFDSIAKRIIDGNGKQLVVKYPELPYFLAAAEAAGFEIPLTEALYEFCKNENYEMFDNMNRPSRSFWRTLTKDSDGE